MDGTRVKQELDALGRRLEELKAGSEKLTGTKAYPAHQ
jgi:hypothetical protein